MAIDRLAEEAKSSRRTIADALAVLQTARGFTGQSQAEIRVLRGRGFGNARDWSKVASSQGFRCEFPTQPKRELFWRNREFWCENRQFL